MAGQIWQYPLKRGSNSGRKTATSIPANNTRVSLTIQNHGSKSLLVRTDGTAPTASDFDAALAPASSETQGNGGSVSIEGLTGTISVAAVSGTPKYSVLELEQA